MPLNPLLEIAPFSWLAIGSALFCGFIVGIERQFRDKPVGIRTSSLIVLGTYMFITMSLHVTTEVTDPSRIIGQVVTGIGFLGAGVMLSQEGRVFGVTSAATIWTLAAIGVCIALIDEATAIKLSLVVVAILYVVDMLEDASSRLTRDVNNKFIHWRQRKR